MLHLHRLTTLVAGLLAITITTNAAGAQPAAVVRTPRPEASVIGTVPVGGAARAPVASTGWTLLGATGGAVLGAIAGGIIGPSIGREPQPCRDGGDPDGCLGAQAPRIIWGVGIGTTLGAPIGAHLGNRRRGRLAYTVLTSVALFAGEVIALNSLIEDGRTEHNETVRNIAIGAPILQIIATTMVERAFTPR